MNGNKKNRSVQFSLAQLFLLVGALTLPHFMSACTKSETGEVQKTSVSCPFDEQISTNCLVASTGGVLSSLLGSDILAWGLGSPVGQVEKNIPRGYYKDKEVIWSNSDFIPPNIKAGISIFHLTGIFAGAPNELTSNMVHDSGVVSYTMANEANRDSGLTYPNDPIGYRAIPSLAKDKSFGFPVAGRSVDRTGWDNSCEFGGAAGGNRVCKCGLGNTIEEKISHCAQHGIIGPHATWDGAQKGIAGEGVWRLVGRTGSRAFSQFGREVWRDERTKMLWSSLVGHSSWCRASGANNILGNPAASNDPMGYCNGTVTPYDGIVQVGGLFSAGINKADSGCYEDIDDNSGNDFFSSNHSSFNHEGKVGLNLSSTPSVAWRLPTLNDYLQAIVDGLPYVVPENADVQTLEENLSQNFNEWTANVFIPIPNYALAFNTANGGISFANRPSPLHFRCVGR